MINELSSRGMENEFAENHQDYNEANPYINIDAANVDEFAPVHQGAEVVKLNDRPDAYDLYISNSSFEEPADASTIE